MMFDLEVVEVLGEGRTVLASVSEHRPSQSAVGAPGQTLQRVMLLLPSGERLQPPVRIVARGLTMRVLGSQVGPVSGEPSIVTCELVNLDLPDSVQVSLPGARALDKATGRFVQSSAPLWAGEAHISSSAPAVADVAGEEAPVDRVTITLPLDAPYAAGHEVFVTATRAPGLGGAVFRLSGEVLDSTAATRRVIGYRPGV